MIELRQQLDKERSVRMMLEEQVRQAGGWGGSSPSPFLPISASLEQLVIYRSACFVPGLGMESPVGSKPAGTCPIRGHHLCWVGGLVRGSCTVKVQL